MNQLLKRLVREICRQASVRAAHRKVRGYSTVFRLESPLTDRYEALKTADLWGGKIPIGVIYRNDAAECREIKRIFRQEAAPEDIACRVDMSCVMMR